MPPTTIPTLPRPPKIQLSFFDGSDPLDWLFQADQFFQFYNITWESRLHMAAFYMREYALSWFKWMYQNHQLSDWLSFSCALELRFGPSTYANNQAELFKLCQNSTVTEYQKSFEKLCNRVLGLTPEMILNCFISALVPEIRREIVVLQPTSITQAMGLAKLLESKIHDSRKYYRNPIIPQPSPHLLPPPPHPIFQPQTTTTTPTSTTYKKAFIHPITRM